MFLDVLLVRDARKLLHQVSNQREGHVRISNRSQRGLGHLERFAQILFERRRRGIAPNGKWPKVRWQARSMRQQMAERDGVLGIFTLNLEISQVVIDTIIELEFALLHLLEQSNSGHRLER